MKKKFIVILFLLQQTFALAEDTIYVSFSKTSLLVFDSEILFDDVGSDDVIFERNGNKLKLAAAIRNFGETNLHVETENGLYSFVLIYQENPKRTVYVIKSGQITSETMTKTETGQSSSSVNKEIPGDVQNGGKKKEVKKESKKLTSQQIELDKNCAIIESKENSLSGFGILNKKLFFYLGDMYVSGDKMYFKLILKNSSNIPFDVNLIRFVVRNKKGQVKGAAVQEDILSPTYVHNDKSNQIAPRGTEGDKICKIFVFDKFTIDNEKILHIELWEVGGDRNVEFTINSTDLLKVKAL
jgi:conjugative transposon TraN protein